MGVELLCVLLLEAKDDLNRDASLIRAKHLAGLSVHHDLRGVLVNVCCYSTTDNFGFCNSFLL